jgi:hypothetical protein
MALRPLLNDIRYWPAVNEQRTPHGQVAARDTGGENALYLSGDGL